MGEKRKGKNGSKSSTRPHKRDNCLNIFVICLSESTFLPHRHTQTHTIIYTMNTHIYYLHFEIEMFSILMLFLLVLQPPLSRYIHFHTQFFSSSSSSFIDFHLPKQNIIFHSLHTYTVCCLRSCSLFSFHTHTHICVMKAT